MVGVPALTRWVCGPSGADLLPELDPRSQSIIGGPSTKHTSSAVIAAYAERNVM